MAAFEKIRDPHFSVSLPDGERRECDPREVIGQIQKEKDPRRQRELLATAFSLPEGYSLTPHQFLSVISGMLAYCRAAEETYDVAGTNAEILMLYGGSVTLTDLRGMNDLEKLALLAHGHRINARRRLDFQQDVGSLFDKESTLRAELVRVAFSNDTRQMDRHLEMLSRT